MAANPTIANPNLIPDAQHTASESRQLRLTSLLQRIEVLLSRAFGDDEQTIANSLRGF
jgi:hypothetical protein